MISFYKLTLIISILTLFNGCVSYAKPPRPPEVKVITNYVTITNKIIITNQYYGFVNLNNETNIAKVFSFPLKIHTNGGEAIDLEFYEFDSTRTNILNYTNLTYRLTTNSPPVLFIDTAIAPVK